MRRDTGVDNAYGDAHSGGEFVDVTIVVGYGSLVFDEFRAGGECCGAVRWAFRRSIRR